MIMLQQEDSLSAYNTRTDYPEAAGQKLHPSPARLPITNTGHFYSLSWITTTTPPRKSLLQKCLILKTKEAAIICHRRNTQ